MSDRSLPIGLVAARRSPLLDPASLPPPLMKSHRTAVWAELRVQAGNAACSPPVSEGNSPPVSGPPRAQILVALVTVASLSITRCEHHLADR